jgi:hypothetical protein
MDWQSIEVMGTGIMLSPQRPSNHATMGRIGDVTSNSSLSNLSSTSVLPLLDF